MKLKYFLIIIVIIYLFSCKSTKNDEDYPCPVYNSDLENISGITETDANGNLIGNIDPDDWYFARKKTNSNFRPVELSIFWVKFEDEKIKIHWETESESNLTYWNILRTEINQLIDPLLVNPDHIEAYNTSELVEYDFIDELEFECDTNYYYWLEIHENSNEVGYSEPVNLFIPEFTIYSFGPAFPNHGNIEIYIPYAMQEQKKVTIIIIDNEGKLIDTLVNEVKDIGEYEAIWTVPNGKNGMFRCIFHIDQEHHWRGDILVQ